MFYIFYVTVYAYVNELYTVHSVIYNLYLDEKQIIDKINFNFKFSTSNILILWANQII